MRRDKKTIEFSKQPFKEDVGPQKIDSIQFSTLSGNEVLKAAECQVSRAAYYDEKDTRRPVENGVMDLRMGPPRSGANCITCGGDFLECPGHWGYLPLALPVYNVGYLNTIVGVLKSICKNCSKILLEEKQRDIYLKRMRNPNSEHLKKAETLKAVVRESAKVIHCPKCGYKNGFIKKDSLKIEHRVKDDFKGIVNSKKFIDPKMVYQLLRNVQDEDCELLYLKGRPENLLVTNILVPPTAIRPSTKLGGNLSREDDISERLRRIIQANSILHQDLLEPNPQYKTLESWDHLQIQVARYINSESVGPLPFSPEQLSGFSQRIKGKQGRFRSNLSGKRVEYTARTVISPDPNLKVTEVGVPMLVAMTLTYPERVTHHNIEKLRQCVRNGLNKYPGAKMLIPADGIPIALLGSFRSRWADELKYGDIVQRHLEDGDIVLFNRQPSLHRMSMMCHRARIMPWRTLRFNESVCNPYNADFDGDEMNLHVPQTEEARAEALMLMGVQNNLCTPKNGEILVASTQDFLTSSYLITRKDTFYDRSTFALLCCYLVDGMEAIDLPTPALIKPVELWTGKQLFSVLLRPHANLRVYVNLTVAEKRYDSKETMCPKDGFVYIRNSELISGQLGKAALGNGNKDGIYSVLLRDYGSHAAATSMNRLAKLSARWIGNHGFSIGIDDVQPGDALNKEKKVTIDKEYGHCTNDIRRYISGRLEPQPGCNKAETLEAQITKTLNKIRQTIADVCKNNLNWRNSPLIMSQCGSKGSDINICQMVACVGQQSVGGRRAPNGFVGRTLPHFEREAKDPDAKGFVQNSFYTGLSATEFFFHTMGGREGLVDTAVKTATTGYMSRRLIKALEDLSVSYDYTVRDSSACIVQFIYGSDGMDPAQMEDKDGLPLNFERILMKAKASCPAMEQKILTIEVIKKIIDQIIEKRLLKSKTTPEGIKQGSSGAEMQQKETLVSCSRSFPSSSDTPPEERCLVAFASSLRDFVEKKYQSSYLENVLSDISGITRQQLLVFLETSISRYLSKKIEAGTAVGAIGAHSIGEPGTQMTLKTFHFAGVASMNVTLGVPRIIEIINATKKISTPIITTVLQCDNNDKIAKLVKGRIERTFLEQIATSINTSLTSGSASITITLDMKRIKGDELSIDADTVKETILQGQSAKKREQMEQLVKVLHPGKLQVFLKSNRDELQFELHRLKKKLSKLVVKGIGSVERAIIIDEGKRKDPGQGNAKENDPGQIKKLKILVEGNGLLPIMGVEGVNSSKTTSNHIIEVQKTLGIEAARNKIINEIKDTMSSHGMKIDIRHMMLLADLMTSKGEILGITRYGVQKMKDSVLMLASFERPTEHLFNASVNGTVDRMLGATESIIMGMPMLIGTGMFKLRQSVPPVELAYGPDPILR